MSPRGGIAGPHASNKTSVPYAVNAPSEDQHGTRNEQQRQNQFSERCFVNSPEKFEAEPGSSNEERQTDHEQFNRFRCNGSLGAEPKRAHQKNRHGNRLEYRALHLFRPAAKSRPYRD